MSVVKPITKALPSGDELLIRSATNQDAAAVLAYAERVSGESDFLSFGPGELGITLEQEQAFLHGHEESPNRVYIIGLVRGIIVATADVGASPRPRLQHRGELGMSVARGYWRQGIAGALLDTIIDWARANPVLTKLDLRVHTHNVRALALYRGRGFVEEGTLLRQVMVNGQAFDLHAMGLDV